MRRFLLVAAIVGMASGAQAADMPDFLRGSFTAPVARTNWQGFYIGGQASYGAADMDFTNSAQDLLKKLLNNIDVETAVQHLELAAAAEDQYAKQRFRRLRRLQLAVDRCRRRCRAQLHPRQVLQQLATGDQTRFVLLPDRLSDHVHRVVEFGNDRLPIMARFASAAVMRSAASCRICSAASRWGRPISTASPNTAFPTNMSARRIPALPDIGPSERKLADACATRISSTATPAASAST